MQSCETKKEIKWHFASDDVVDNTHQQSDNLRVDIYIDATTSMLGFNSNSPTNFSRLVDDMESTVKNVWKQTDVRYYKFTTKIDSLSRQDFESAKTDPRFYVDRYTANQLNIDNAIENIDPKRVNIIVTDLFFKGQDKNKVVSALSESCIKKGIEIGILSASSPFTGLVADVDPAVQINNEDRPLYVLILTNKENIKKVFDAFKGKTYINADKKFLITKYPLESFGVIVEKKKGNDNSAINSDQGSVNRYKDFGNVFGFKLKEKDKDGYLTFEITPVVSSGIASFNDRNLKFTTYKRTVEIKDSVLTDDLSFTNVKVSSGKITGEIKVRTKEKGDVSYSVLVGFDNTVPLQMPQWVKSYDTEAYTALTPKAKNHFFE